MVVNSSQGNVNIEKVIPVRGREISSKVVVDVFLKKSYISLDKVEPKRHFRQDKLEQ